MSLETYSGSYERAVIIQNPVSSNAGRYNSQVDFLPLPSIPLRTEHEKGIPFQDSFRRLMDRTYKILEPGDVILVRSGDGLLHWVLNGLMQDEAVEQNFHKLPVIALPEGNANDIAMQMNGKARVDRILQEGRAVDLRPLDVAISHGQTAIPLRRSIGYFSVGATVEAAERLDKLKHSTNPFVKIKLLRKIIEPPLTVKAIANAPWLSFGQPVQLDQPQEGEFLATDRLFVTGNRIAKYGRPHAALDSPEFEEFISYAEGYTETLRSLLKMQQGRLEGTMQKAVTFNVSAPNGKLVLIQYDGEKAEILSGSTVSVSRSKRSYRVLSLLLNAPAADKNAVY